MMMIYSIILFVLFLNSLISIILFVLFLNYLIKKSPCCSLIKYLSASILQKVENKCVNFLIFCLLWKILVLLRVENGILMVILNLDGSG